MGNYNMLSPKEKAKDLVEKFKLYSWISCIEGNEELSNIESAKYCALIAVDEMIIQNGEAHLLGKIDHDYYVLNNSYLFDIKQEIEKL